jgi:hypothetical protein
LSLSKTFMFHLMSLTYAYTYDAFTKITVIDLTTTFRHFLKETLMEVFVLCSKNPTNETYSQDILKHKTLYC